MAAISIVTATRNVAHVVPRLLDSLVAQTTPDFDWIIADAVSSDGTTELLKRATQHYKWIRVVSEPDFGFYDALNKAIARSTAPFYVVAGADDTFRPDAVERYLDSASSSLDVVLADVMIDGVRRGGFRPGKAWLGHPSVFQGSHSVGMMFRRGLHDRFGLYSPRYPLLADGYFLKCLLRARDVNFLRVPFVAGEFATGGMTTTGKAQILTETWRIQLATEPSPLLQTALFAAKLAVRLPSIIRESRLAMRNAAT